MTPEISLIIPSAGSIEELCAASKKAQTFLAQHLNAPFEIIFVPNGPLRKKLKERNLSLNELESVSLCYDCVLVGKGVAVKQGFEKARGKYIFYTDVDLPCDLTFLLEAYELLKKGRADLVTANRRLSNSWFNVPTEHLHFVYRRHCFGLVFNYVIRQLFPINTTDTQAGFKGMTRNLATLFFDKMTCYGFLFDLELHLVAAVNGYTKKSLPVSFKLFHEKSTVRILRELLASVYWLGRLKYQLLSGLYRADDPRGNVSNRLVFRHEANTI